MWTVYGSAAENKLSVRSMINDQEVIIALCGGRMGTQRYSYASGLILFDFEATRYDEEETRGIVRDYSTVYLGAALMLAISRGQDGALLRKQLPLIKNNIESALLQWPPSKIYKDVPLKKVVFNMATYVA